MTEAEAMEADVEAVIAYIEMEPLEDGRVPSATEAHRAATRLSDRLQRYEAVVANARLVSKVFGPTPLLDASLRQLDEFAEMGSARPLSAERDGDSVSAEDSPPATDSGDTGRTGSPSPATQETGE